MPNTIVLKRSSTASAVPGAGSLAVGELAINLADRRLYSKNAGGAVFNITIDGTHVTSGTVAVANGGTGSTTAAAARTALGATTVGGNLFALTNPSAVRFVRIDADNTVTAVAAIPQNSRTAAYTLVAADSGKHISTTTGGVTVPASVFGIGDAVTIFNNSAANQTITQGASVTLRLAGTSTTGNRTLGQWGTCTLLCVASNVFVISGAGLT